MIIYSPKALSTLKQSLQKKVVVKEDPLYGYMKGGAGIMGKKSHPVINDKLN